MKLFDLYAIESCVITKNVVIDNIKLDYWKISIHWSEITFIYFYDSSLKVNIIFILTKRIGLAVIKRYRSNKRFSSIILIFSLPLLILLNDTHGKFLPKYRIKSQKSRANRDETFSIFSFFFFPPSPSLVHVFTPSDKRRSITVWCCPRRKLISSR